MNNTLAQIIRAVSAAALISTASISWADTSSELLEQAIYAEEVEGNLDQAELLYKKVIAEADSSREPAALAMYRLAVVYEARGDQAASREMLSRILADMSDQESIVSQARALLQKIDYADIELIPEPWLNGEEVSYRMYIQTGRQVGAMTSSYQLSNQGGKDAWLVSATIAGGASLYSASISDANSMEPISSKIASPNLGRVKSAYTENKIITTYMKKGADVDKEKDFSGRIFDGTQIFPLVRRLPLSEGYKLKTQIYAGLADSILQMDLKVKELKTVQALGRDFQAYEVEAKLTNLDVVIQTLHFTISDDATRQILSIDEGPAYYEIDRVIQKGEGELAKYTYEDLGISFEADQKVHVLDRGFSDKSVAASLYIVAPGFKDRIKVTVITPETDNDGAEMRIPENKLAYHLEGIEKKYSSYELLEEMPSDFSIAGEHAVGGSYQITDGDKLRVFTRFYVAKNDVLYYFTMENPLTEYEGRMKGLLTMLETVELF